MIMTRHILLFLFGLLAAAQSFAAPLCRIVRYDENDGLPQWHITQMTQDRQGMMWLSTWNGLCRFDGYEFRGFKGHVGDGSGLSVDRFRSVWLADDGNIGCRVEDDVFVFNLKTYRFEKRTDMKSTHKSAKAVKKDRPYSYRDAEGNTWTVYYDGTLTAAEPGKRPVAYTECGTLESARYCLPDRQGNLWVASASGLYKLCFPKQNVEIYRSPVEAETKAFFVDRHGRYWIASKGDNAVVVRDKENRLVGWLAADGRIVKTHAALSSPVYCITGMPNGTVWTGSKPGGLMRLTEQAGGMSYKVERIGGLPCNEVYDIKPDRWGRLWVATLGGGLCCVENPQAENPRVLSPGRGLNGYPKKLAQKVRMIHITQSGVMLAATTDALVACRLLPGRRVGNMLFRCHTREPNRKDALSCSATMNVAEDAKGRIFVGTESGGVNMITSRDLTAEKLSFRHFGKNNGTSSDVALSVVPFGDKLLQVGSNNIVIFSPDNGSQMTFGRSFFLSECRLSEAIPMRLPDGRWIFGMQDGYFTVSPKRLRKSDFVPSIALTGISVQGERKDWAINAADTIVLKSDERSLTLSFAALDYSPEPDIRYAFKLLKDGDDTAHGWNMIGHDHSATLLDLSPTTYRLLIRSTNADGTWTDNVRTLTIIVTPAFWETTFAHVLIALLMLSFIGGAIYIFIYIKRIKRQRHEALEAYLSLLNGGAEQSAPSEKPLRPELSEEDDAMMRRVSAFVEEHIGDAEIGVGDMAAAAAVSRSGLQRKMKQIMGVTPLDFLKEARIKHACHLLRTTSMTVSEVAYACGYSDPKYFSRSFKASAGKSPTEWREQEKIL